MYFFVFVTLTIIFLSISTWFRLLRNPAGFPLCHRVPHPPVPNPFLANAITMLLVVLGLYSIYTRPDVPQNITLQVLASANLQSAFIAIVLLSLLTITFYRLASFDEYGITDEKLGRQLKDGFYGFCLAIIPVTVIRLICLPFLDKEGMHPLIKLVQDSNSAVIWGHVIFAAVIIAPILEELMYRVIVQSWLRKFLPAAPAIIISAALFSLMHGLEAAIALMPLAIILGYIYEVRHSYFACATTHMLFNGVNLLLVLLAPENATVPPAE